MDFETIDMLLKRSLQIMVRFFKTKMILSQTDRLLQPTSPFKKTNPSNMSQFCWYFSYSWALWACLCIRRPPVNLWCKSVLNISPFSKQCPSSTNVFNCYFKVCKNIALPASFSCLSTDGWDVIFFPLKIPWLFNASGALYKEHK